MVNREQTIQFAKQSGLYETLQDGMPGAAQWIGLEEELEAFAKLVAEHSASVEREACAKLSENCFEGVNSEGQPIFGAASATAIRARGNT